MIDVCFFFEEEDGIGDSSVTGVQTCALPIYQPNHKSPAPSSTSGTLWGTIAVRLKSFRGPSIRAATSAETPALMCTTVPPAKSSAPSFASQPPDPHTQWASGSYTNVAHRRMNTT